MRNDILLFSITVLIIIIIILINNNNNNSYYSSGENIGLRRFRHDSLTFRLVYPAVCTDITMRNVWSLRKQTARRNDLTTPAWSGGRNQNVTGLYHADSWERYLPMRNSVTTSLLPSKQDTEQVEEKEDASHSPAVYGHDVTGVTGNDNGPLCEESERSEER